jgi:DNA repair exonuclease SbcCD ATPase subunit
VTPLALRITNFRGFRDTQEFRFAGRPGLYFLQGLNEAEPRLGSNGAGKSTVWDALSWLFHGATARGLKGADVCNWLETKGTRVELDALTEAEEPFTVCRTWGPISWTLTTCAGDVIDLASEEGNPVLAGLGGLRLDRAPFMSCVVLAQPPQPMFLDMKAREQAELFSSVMGLDGWVARSESASRMAGEQEAAARRAERDLAAAEGELAALERLGPDRARQWEKERAARLDVIAIEYETALEYDDTKEELERFEKWHQDALAAAESLTPTDHQMGLWRRAVEDLRDAEERVRAAQTDWERAQAHAEGLANGEPCPTCGRAVDHVAADDLIAAAMRHAGGRRVVLNGAKAGLEQAQKIAADFEKAETIVRDKLRGAHLHTARTRDDLAEARRRREDATRHLDRLERDAERIEAEANPHAGEAGRLDECRERVAAARAAADECERRRSLYSFWVRGFREVRLGLIAEALAELEVEANSACESLGLVGWELSFSVDRETKSGGVQRGFSVGVRSPTSTRAVPWEAWSGGEGQRLRVAAQMGLADLVRSRTGASFPVEVWDEPTAGMSPQGVDDLLRALRDRALAEGREVWIVDHRSPAYGAFDGGATIVKTAAGSQVRADV